MHRLQLQLYKTEICLITVHLAGLCECVSALQLPITSLRFIAPINALAPCNHHATTIGTKLILISLRYLIVISHEATKSHRMSIARRQPKRTFTAI